MKVTARQEIECKSCVYGSFDLIANVLYLKDKKLKECFLLSTVYESTNQKDKEVSYGKEKDKRRRVCNSPK